MEGGRRGGTRNEPISSRREAASVVVGGQKNPSSWPRGEGRGMEEEEEEEEREKRSY